MQKDTKCSDENPVHGLRQAQICGGVKHVNAKYYTPTSVSILQSMTNIFVVILCLCRNKQTNSNTE